MISVALLNSGQDEGGGLPAISSDSHSQVGVWRPTLPGLFQGPTQGLDDKPGPSEDGSDLFNQMLGDFRGAIFQNGL